MTHYFKIKRNYNENKSKYERDSESIYNLLI